MTSALDMSLDDIIKNNKKSGSGNSRGRGRGRGGGAGPTRRFNNRAPNRAAPYVAAKAPETTWQHDMFSDQGAAYLAQPVRASAIETGTKLYISNLDYGVSNEDIKELFSEVGDLKRYAIHYDRSGRSKGTAEVVFSRRADALAAVKRYNNVQLDGKPMKIEIVGTNIATPAAATPAVNIAFGNPNGVPRGGQGRGGVIGRPRGGAGAGAGAGRGFRRGNRRGRGQGEKVSAEDLDADLEKYHSEAMQTN
uniref:RNA and export factor-binding protein 2 n=1 Tax=Rhizophora mucronata TaxID=61149 RepID=A0A2P2J9H3_RHIMU